MKALKALKALIVDRRNRLLIVLVLAALGTLALAALGTLISATQENIATIPLAVISGGLISTFVVLLNERIKHDADVSDLRFALASDLALNIVWARYNCNPLNFTFDTAWVHFRTESLLAVLRYKSDMAYSDEALDTLVRTVDRMHSFNENRITLQALMKIRGGVNPDLSAVMAKAATELYWYYLPLLVCDLPYTQLARIRYEGDFPNPTQLDMCRNRRETEMSGHDIESWPDFQRRLTEARLT